MRLTLACPDALRRDANQLALALGLGPDDDQTFGVPCFIDAGGNRYCVASMEDGRAWLSALETGTLPEPGWTVDFAAANRALSALIVAEDSSTVQTDVLTAIADRMGADTIARIGLSLDPDYA